MPGCLKIISLVESSPLICNIASVEYPMPFEYKVNGIRRNKPYCFADGIYPSCPFFISTISNPATKMDLLLAKIQEAVRKDIERAFGVL